MSKVQEVARAIALALIPARASGANPVIDCEPLARAAIKAMREPTERMIVDGLRVGNSMGQLWELQLRAAHNAMIDTALEEAEPKDTVYCGRCGERVPGTGCDTDDCPIRYWHDRDDEVYG